MFPFFGIFSVPRENVPVPAIWRLFTVLGRSRHFFPPPAWSTGPSLPADAQFRLLDFLLFIFEISLQQLGSRP